MEFSFPYPPTEVRAYANGKRVKVLVIGTGIIIPNLPTGTNAISLYYSATSGSAASKLTQQTPRKAPVPYYKQGKKNRWSR